MKDLPVVDGICLLKTPARDGISAEFRPLLLVSASEIYKAELGATSNDPEIMIRNARRIFADVKVYTDLKEANAAAQATWNNTQYFFKYGTFILDIPRSF